MRRTEIPNNTPEQVMAYVRAALVVLEEVDPPADLREAVFTASVGLISGKQIMMEQPQPVDLGALRGLSRH